MISMSEVEKSSIEIVSLRSTLPVLVSESLAMEKGEQSGSVRFFANNWVALICGRHLFVWNYGISANKKSGASACRKLTLPVSDVSHNADLVHLVENSNSTMIGCLVVSPEGVMRYWSTLHQEDSYTETSANCLKGEECSQILSCFLGVFLLATRSGSLVLIDTRTSDESISYRVVGRGAGLLSGIGRRMSSFFTMSSSVSNSSTNMKLNRIRSRHHPACTNAIQVLVLNDKQLQIWSFSETLDEKHECTLNIGQSIRDHVALSVWSTEAYRLRDLVVKLIDCDVRCDNAYILASAVNEAAEPAHYLLCVYDLINEKIEYCSELKIDDKTEQPDQSSQFACSDFNGGRLSPDYRLMLPSDDASLKVYPCLFAAVYCTKWLRVVQVISGEESNKLLFSGGNDCLMGVGPGQSGETLLLFSQAHNILSVGHHAVSLNNQSLNSSFQRGQLQSGPRMNFLNQSVNSSTSIQQPSYSLMAGGDISRPLIPEVADDSSDLSSSLNQIARLYWLGYKAQTRQMANDLLASIKCGKFEHYLDHCLIKLARSVMNQKPLQDPRWRQAFKEELSSNVHSKESSMIQSQQIMEKLSCLHKLQELLQFTGLSSALGFLSNSEIGTICLPVYPAELEVGGLCEGDSDEGAAATLNVWYTPAYLEQLAEITISMSTFYQIYSKESCAVVDDTIITLISSLNYPPKVFDLLRHIDLFYSEICLMPSFLRDLTNHWMTVYKDVLSQRSLPGQKLAYASSQSCGDKPSKLLELLAVLKYLAKLFVSMLREVSKQRDQRLMPMLPSTSSSAPNTGLLSCWITSSWPAGILNELLNFYESVVEFGESLEDSECCIRAQELASLILYFMQQRVEWAEAYLHSHQNNVPLPVARTVANLKKEYDRTKQVLIRPIAYRLGKVSHALILAENHCEFDLMIRLCDEQADIDRLKTYMHDFKDRGFQEFAVSWFVKEGKRGQLQHLLAAASAQERTLYQAGEAGPKTSGLLHLLEGEEVRDIGWLHHVQTGDFTKAGMKLLELGAHEQRFIGKKKTLLSLAKLTHFANQSDSDLKEERELNYINKSLDIIKAQEELPREVCEQVLSLESGPTQAILSLSQIIRLYVADFEDALGDIRHPSLVEFIKGINLLKYLESEEEREELKVHVWARALLLEDWSSLQTMDATEAFRGALFFRIASILRADNYPLEELLPSLETLIDCEELVAMKDDVQFQYSLKAVHELVLSECHDQNDFIEHMVVT